MTDENLIQLASANAFQLTESGKKSDWIIRENVTDEELHRFNGRISDEDMFEILRFARKYELIALNVGMQHQKKIQDAKLIQENTELRAKLEAIIRHNDFLADTVERLTTGEGNGDSATD